MDTTALGAFLSGVGAVLSSLWAVRRLSRKAEQDCRQRIDELQEALMRGVTIGEHHEK
jgi:hypothetical protein